MQVYVYSLSPSAAHCKANNFRQQGNSPPEWLNLLGACTLNRLPLDDDDFRSRTENKVAILLELNFER